MKELVKAPRPDSVDGSTPKTMTGCGSLYVTLGEVDGKLFEVFAKLGKAGGCGAAQTEAISRLVSLALRFGITPEQIVKQIKGISCHNSGPGCAQSCADSIGVEIEKTYAEDAEAPAEVKLCEPDGKTYTSLPAKLKCKFCGTFWVAEEDRPNCLAGPEKETDEPDRD